MCFLKIIQTLMLCSFLIFDNFLILQKKDLLNIVLNYLWIHPFRIMIDFHFFIFTQSSLSMIRFNFHKFYFSHFEGSSSLLSTFLHFSYPLSYPVVKTSFSRCFVSGLAKWYHFLQVFWLHQFILMRPYSFKSHTRLWHNFHKTSS